MDHASLGGVCSRRLVSLRLLFGCLLLALCHLGTSSCLTTAAAALTTGTRQDGAAAGGATALIRYLRSCLVLLQEELVLKSFVLLLEL